MKKAVKIFLLIFILTISLNFVTAAQPQVINQGITIEYPKFDLIQQDKDFTFYFHIFNTTNGVLLTNSSVSCTFHLYNPYGTHIIEQDNNVKMYNNKIDFEVIVNKNNFSQIGDYSYIFSCNTSVLGGAVSASVRATNSTTSTNSSEAIFYALITIIIFFLLIILSYIAWILPYKPQRNEKNQIMFIPKAKYLKIGLIPVIYALFIWFLNILVGISDNFISLNMYYGLISFLFTLFINLAYPIIIFCLIIAGYNIIKDIQLNKLIKKFGYANG